MSKDAVNMFPVVTMSPYVVIIVKQSTWIYISEDLHNVM